MSIPICQSFLGISKASCAGNSAQPEQLWVFLLFLNIIHFLIPVSSRHGIVNKLMVSLSFMLIPCVFCSEPCMTYIKKICKLFPFLQQRDEALVLRNGTETCVLRNNMLTFPQCMRYTLRTEIKAGAISEDRRAGKYF